MKYCSRCKEEKPEEEFAKNQIWCKSCKANHHKEYYQDNKEKFESTNRRGRKRRNEWYVEQKEKPCSQCKGEFPPYVMQWHHRDPTTKLYHLADISWSASRQTIIDEIAKCDLLCANCHAIVTHGSIV